VSPLVTLRRDYERTDQGRDWVRIAAALVLAISVAGLAVLQVRDLRDGLFFAGGIGASLLVLWLASLGLIRGVRRFFPTRWPYLWRQGLANLYRPANQTVTVVLSLGFGATLLATLFLVQHNLLRDLRFELLERRERYFAREAKPLATVLKQGQTAGLFRRSPALATARTLMDDSWSTASASRCRRPAARIT